MTKLHVSDQYNTGQIADQAGIYELRLKFNGQVFALQTVAEVGDDIVFDIGILNEDFVYTCVELVAPDGATIALEPVQIRILL